MPQRSAGPLGKSKTTRYILPYSVGWSGVAAVRINGTLRLRTTPCGMSGRSVCGAVPLPDSYIILARSVTYAQRMQKSLGRAGIRCHIFRPPRDLTEKGCAYAVRVAVSDLPEALTALHKDGLDPVQIFIFQKGLYQEVEA